jgi:glycosyltransferase involved in cell wall biosynthesis
MPASWIDPADGEALCQAMLAIYASPVYAATLAARSRVRARLFSWECCADETVQAYRRALK